MFLILVDNTEFLFYFLQKYIEGLLFVLVHGFLLLEVMPVSEVWGKTALSLQKQHQHQNTFSLTVGEKQSSTQKRIQLKDEIHRRHL